MIVDDPIKGIIIPELGEL